MEIKAELMKRGVRDLGGKKKILIIRLQKAMEERNESQDAGPCQLGDRCQQCTKYEDIIDNLLKEIQQLKSRPEEVEVEAALKKASATSAVPKKNYRQALVGTSEVGIKVVEGGKEVEEQKEVEEGKEVEEQKEVEGGKEVDERKEIEGGKKVLVLGDSIVKYIGENISDRVEVRAYPGIRIQRMKTVIEKIDPVSEKLNGLIIHVGTNDVSNRNVMGKIRFVREMEDLVRLAIDRFGANRVVVSGLLYRADIKSEVVDTFNFFLLRMCERVGVCFVEGNCWLDGSVLARDGLHLNRWGSKLLGALLGRVGENLIDRL